MAKARFKKSDFRDRIRIGGGFVSNGHWMIPCAEDHRLTSVDTIRAAFGTSDVVDLPETSARQVLDGIKGETEFRRTGIIMEASAGKYCGMVTARLYRSDDGQIAAFNVEYLRILEEPQILFGDGPESSFKVGESCIMPVKVALPEWMVPAESLAA